MLQQRWVHRINPITSVVWYLRYWRNLPPVHLHHLRMHQHHREATSHQPLLPSLPPSNTQTLPLPSSTPQMSSGNTQGILSPFNAVLRCCKAVFGSAGMPWWRPRSKPPRSLLKQERLGTQAGHRGSQPRSASLLASLFVSCFLTRMMGHSQVIFDSQLPICSNI